MKKNFFTLLGVVLTLFLAFSCSKANNESNENFEKEQLSEKLSVDKDFQDLTEMITTAQEISTKAKFIKDFDKDRLLNEGNKYLAEITGYSESEIEKINEILINRVVKVLNKYPELKAKQNNSLFINEVVNLSITDSYPRAAKRSCADCPREGRAKMTAGILLGAATGSVAGFFGAWAGAVVGFWVAAEETVTCLKAAGC